MFVSWMRVRVRVHIEGKRKLKVRFLKIVKAFR